MRILPTSLTGGLSGVIAWLTAHAERFNLVSRTEFNPMDAEYGAIGDGVADDQPAFADAYLDAAVAGGTVVIPAGTYKLASDLNWTSNKVSVKGAGSSAVTLKLAGTAKIIARPSPMTVTQGPKFSGFTVLGDTAGPVGAKGVYSGDIVASQWEDVVFKGFFGANAVGLHLDNATNWTELNKFKRLRFDDCTVGIKCSVSASSSNSFARNVWDVHFNLTRANQIGFQTTDNALLYGQKGSFDGNSTANNTVFVDLLGISGSSFSSISGHLDMDFEQTAGTGGVGVREAYPTFQFLCNGIRNYAETMPEDQGGGLDMLNLPGSFRIREGANAYQGVATLVGGQVTVNTSAVKDASAGQRIHLTRQLGAPGAPRGHLEIGTRVAGTSFVIQAIDDAGSLVADTSVVAWTIFGRF
jgi:hypothetical protein